MYKKTLTILEGIEQDIDNNLLIKHTLGDYHGAEGCLLGLVAKNAGIKRSYPSEGTWNRKLAAYEVINVLYHTASNAHVENPTVEQIETRIARKNDRSTEATTRRWVRRAIDYVRAELS